MLGPTNNNNKNNPQLSQQQSPAKSSTPALSTSSSSSCPPTPKKDLSNILGKDVETCKHKEANQKAHAHKAELPALSSASAPAKGSEK
ncbi:hypothetical protein AN958_10780 [Leucoagaricus sp. SymC.cos]|nr:hypothetical protein AN958_10780 [Leucoagaricus sp. SymC.cos]